VITGKYLTGWPLASSHQPDGPWALKPRPLLSQVNIKKQNIKQVLIFSIFCAYNCIKMLLQHYHNLPSNYLNIKETLFEKRLDSFDIFYGLMTRNCVIWPICELILT